MTAESDLARGRNMDRIRDALATATTAFKEAKGAAEIANVTLASLIKTRADANNANAATFAAQLWTDAAERFDSAARRLETGDIRGARSRADEAEALYRDAELTAIKAQYLSQTRALLAEADQARVARVAPKTYEKARALLAQAERELNENRYDTDLPRSLAQQANYEARHAIYLAKVLGAMRDEDRSLEDIISGVRGTARSGGRRGRQGRAARPGRRSRRRRTSSPTSKACASRPRNPRSTSPIAARGSASSRKRFAISTSSSAACRRSASRSCSGSRPRRGSASSSRRSRTCSSATRRASRAKATA